MLQEVQNIKQIPNERKRRWFSDDYFDLIVWLENDDSIYGFQLCYDKFTNERALSWKKDKGYLHELIDDGEIAGEIKKSPVMTPDGDFEKETITDRFKTASGDIDTEIADFVFQKLIQF